MIAPLLLACFSLSPPSRALWMWHGQPLLADVQAQSKFFHFVESPKGDSNHRLSVIFLSEVDPSNASSIGALGDLLQGCHQRGVRVDYLCGDSSWARPVQKDVALEKIDEVLAFNSKEPRARQFDGFQFDVEPYLLPDWPTPSLHDGYLRLFDSSEEHIKKANSGLLLGAAIPRWFDAADLKGLYKEVLDRVDYVAVMDYVSNADQFVREAANTVAYATVKGKQAWLGAEATELPKEPTATFFAKGNAAMESAFSAAQQAFGHDLGFAGVAVEYYESYVALRP